MTTYTSLHPQTSATREPRGGGNEEGVDKEIEVTGVRGETEAEKVHPINGYGYRHISTLKRGPKEKKL